MRPSTLVLVVILAIGLAAGCATRETTSPTGGAASLESSARTAVSGAAETATRGFFPMELGDRWRYHRRFAVTAIDSSHVPHPTYDETIDFVDTHLCTESHDGRDYVVSRREYPGTSYDPFWIRYRQDRAGLYEWDDTSGPPACDTLPPPAKLRVDANGIAAPGSGSWNAVAMKLGVPANVPGWQRAYAALQEKRSLLQELMHGLPSGRGGVLPGEIQRLGYPLYPGRSWVVRADGNFVVHVERPALVRTPAGWFLGWSMRYTSDLFGPNDVVRVWYGPAGYLKLHATFFSEATDENGNPLGTEVAQQVEQLAEIHLVGRSLAAAEAPAGQLATE